jgi:hypothetical protein
VIRDSEYPFDASEKEYVKQAHGGDTVAIVPTLTPGYDIDSAHITITKKDGGVIHPEKVTLATGKTAYQFVMPNDGYKSIKPDFFAKSYAVEIYVTDGTNDLTTYGLVRFNYNEGNFNDVNDKNGLGSIQYGATVNVLISSPGATQGWHVESISGNPAITSKAVEWGYQFTMPASDLKLQVNLKGGTVPPTPPAPIDVKLPATAKDGSNTYNLQYYKDAAMTEVLTDLNVKSGETYYVKVMNPPDGGELSSFAFKDGTKEIGNADTSSGMFTVPSDAASPTAEVSFNSNSYKVVVEVENAPDGCTVSVKPGSGSEVVVTPGSTQVDAKYGDDIAISVTGSREIESIDGLDSVSITGTPAQKGEGKLKPADSVANGSVVTVTVKFKVVHTLKFEFVNDEPGTAQFTLGTETVTDDYVTTATFNTGDSVNIASASREIEKVEGLDPFTLSDDKNGSGKIPDTGDEEITVTVTFKPHVTLKFEFVNDVGGANTVKVNGGKDVSAADPTYGPFLPGETITLSDETRAIVKVEGLEGYKDHKGTIPTGGSDGQEYTVTITFKQFSYKLQMNITGGPKQIILGSAGNEPRNDGYVSVGPWYENDKVLFFAPDGYFIKSISSDVLENVTINASEGYATASASVKINSSHADEATVGVKIELQKNP